MNELEKKNLFWVNIVSLAIVFFLIGVAFLSQILVGNQKPVWCAWEELAKSLPSEKIKLYTFEDQIAYHIWSNLDKKENAQIIVVKGIEGLQEDTSYFLPRGFDEIKVINEKGIEGDKFYLAFRDSKFNELHPPLRNLKAMGYNIGEPKVFIAQGIQTFLVEVWKGN